MSRSRTLLAAFWLFAGTMHFVRAREYEATVPAVRPDRRREDAVSWSGVAEIAGGLAGAPRRDPPARPLVAARRCWSRSSRPTSTWRSTRTQVASAGRPDRPAPALAALGAAADPAAVHALGLARDPVAAQGSRPPAWSRRPPRSSSTPPASPRTAPASSISATASSTGSRDGERPQAVGDQRADRAGVLGVVDRPHDAGADRLLELGVVDPLLGGELGARLLGRQRRGERLAADPELAGGAVERREQELLGGLLEVARARSTRAARTDRRPGSARSCRRRRRGRRPRAAQPTSDAPRRSTQRRAALTARSPAARERDREQRGERERRPRSGTRR